MKRKGVQLSLLDMLEAAESEPTVQTTVAAGSFIAICHLEPLTHQDAIVLQIRRDRATVAEGEWGSDPGREFYERRIEACIAMLERS